MALKVDRATRQRYTTSHTRLTNLTCVIRDKAAMRSQKLGRLETQWTEFGEMFARMKDWVARLDGQLPPDARQTDTLEEVRPRMI